MSPLSHDREKDTASIGVRDPRAPTTKYLRQLSLSRLMIITLSSKRGAILKGTTRGNSFVISRYEIFAIILV